MIDNWIKNIRTFHGPTKTLMRRMEEPHYEPLSNLYVRNDLNVYPLGSILRELDSRSAIYTKPNTRRNGEFNAFFSESNVKEYFDYQNMNKFSEHERPIGEMYSINAGMFNRVLKDIRNGRVNASIFNSISPFNCIERTYQHSDGVSTVQAFFGSNSPVKMYVSNEDRIGDISEAYLFSSPGVISLNRSSSELKVLACLCVKKEWLPEVVFRMSFGLELNPKSLCLIVDKEVTDGNRYKKITEWIDEKIINEVARNRIPVHVADSDIKDLLSIKPALKPALVFSEQIEIYNRFIDDWHKETYPETIEEEIIMSE